MAEKEFACVACGSDFGRETAVKECRICHRTFCDECIDKEGYCVPCKEKN